MRKLILNTETKLYEKDGKAYCDSLQVAETFGKEHKNVLRDIEVLECSPQFSRLNFELSDYKVRGKKYPRYLLTKDGFTFLVMGYRGKKAAKFKEAYIERFNRMEDFIDSLLRARMEFPAFTEAILDAHEQPKHYHFSNEINMIYRIVLGMDAKKFREERGLEKGVVIRPYLTTEQIKAIETLQRVDIGLLEIGMDYQERRTVLAKRYDRMKLKAIA